jgi:hypothetical protein
VSCAFFVRRFKDRSKSSTIDALALSLAVLRENADPYHNGEKLE